SPEAPVPVLRAVQRDERVGGCANVAACLRALHTQVICCGAVGRDSAGERLCALLTGIGVDTAGVLRSESRPTITKTRLIGLAQHRHRQQLLRLDEEEVGPLPRSEANRITETVLRAIETVDVACIEDYEKGVISGEVVTMLAAAIAAGADLVQAVKLANVAGGLEVEKFGCVPITVDEVLADLRLEHDRCNGKVRTVDDLVAELNLRRDRGETVAFTNGVFDLLHAGHAEYLNRARQEGSLLVIGLNTDRSVKALGEGPDRPINTQDDRAAVLSALECVDYVVLFDEPTPEALLRRVRPDVLVKGEDWATKGVVGQAFVESYGGRVKLMPLKPGMSTSALIERIRRA
ncbi:MAG TPA: D-glycero-beta-D-manno-heptose 1-phosphate adenylyltransferase, partial [Phycisphaerae bacterium]